MAVVRTFALAVAMAAIVAGSAGSALAQACTRAGVDVTCDDGRRGVFSGDAIIWADGTHSSVASPHPGVIVGNKSLVVVGQGVFVGQGKGAVPMENPSDPRRARCPVLEGVAYCY
jgi:2-polyprenyl-6-methoxyphenol hydroxylase-like FAD-dependent oxidoreductase